MNIQQFKETLGQLMHGGELKLDIKQHDDGFKIVLCEYEEMVFIDMETGEPTGEQTEYNLVRLTLYTDNLGVIRFIEHGYGAFTRANAAEATFVISLVGQTVEGLTEALSDY